MTILGDDTVQLVHDHQDSPKLILVPKCSTICFTSGAQIPRATRDFQNDSQVASPFAPSTSFFFLRLLPKGLEMHNPAAIRSWKSPPANRFPHLSFSGENIRGSLQTELLPPIHSWQQLGCSHTLVFPRTRSAGSGCDVLQVMISFADFMKLWL